jgi:hypothetical protein
MTPKSVSSTSAIVMLPAGDLSIFADLGLDEMELGVTWADLTTIAEHGTGPAARFERARYRLVAEGARLESV